MHREECLATVIIYFIVTALCLKRIMVMGRFYIGVFHGFLPLVCRIICSLGHLLFRFGVVTLRNITTVRVGLCSILLACSQYQAK